MSKKQILKFYSPSCYPCKQLEKVLSNLGDSLQDNYDVVSIDATTNDNRITEYGVRNLPTMIVIDGDEVEKLIGFRGADDLRKFLKL